MTMVEAPLDQAQPETQRKRFRLQSLLNFEITKDKVKRKELMHFSRQLAVFIKAGIPILESLEAIKEEMGSKRFREVLTAIADDLRGGATLAQAAGKFP